MPRRARLQVVAAGLERDERTRRVAAGREPRRGRRVERSAGLEAERGEHRAASATATPGLASTAGSGGNRSAGPSRSPRPPIGRARGRRQTGTSAPTAAAAANSAARRPARGRWRRRARAARRRRRSNRRRGRRRPAALCSRWKRPSRSRGTRSASARAARSTRLSSAGPAAGAVGPSIVRLSGSAGLERQPVAAAGEGDDAVEFVPAVGATPEHVQRQIDLGRRAPQPRRAVRQV